MRPVLFVACLAVLGAVARDAAMRWPDAAPLRGAQGIWAMAAVDGTTADAPVLTAGNMPGGAVVVGGSAPGCVTRDAPVAAAVICAGTVADRGEREAAAALLGPAESPAAPRPPEVVLDYHADGRSAATGLLPSGMSPGRFAGLLPGVATDGLGQAGRAGAEGWERAVEALSIVLPRFREAVARIGNGRLALEGRLLRGFSAGGTRATLLAALPRDWVLSLDLVEAAPLAEVILTKERESLVLSGLLPAGLRPEEATALIGQGAAGEGLAGGGAGAAREWSRTLAVLGELVGLFDRARARIDEGRVEMTGVLRPGYAGDAVARRLSDGLPAGWRPVLVATETPPGEGDRRVSLATGEAEVYRRGFWLPELDFPVSPERCEAETDRALAGGPVPFMAGSAEIDEAGRALVDRLAAIAVRCLNSSRMRLEIAGHTDSVGNDAENQALSEARARTVRAALVERGVREDALDAAGHGESRPVASNDTAEGRARNRRIAFDWSAP